MLGESESGGLAELLKSLLNRLGSGGVTLAESKALRGEVATLLGHPNGVDRCVPPARRSTTERPCHGLTEVKGSRLPNPSSLVMTTC